MGGSLISAADSNADTVDSFKWSSAANGLHLQLKVNDNGHVFEVI